MKRILASVFLVLAVIASVGIFGVQTSQQTEAAIAVSSTLNSGNGVPNVEISAGRPLQIDLAPYVAVTPAGSATPTFYLVARTSGGQQRVYDPASATQTGANQPSWRTEQTNVVLNGSVITITSAETATAGGATSDIQWIASETPLTPGSVITAGTTNTLATTGTGTGRTDTFSAYIRDSSAPTPVIPTDAVAQGAASSTTSANGDDVVWQLPSIPATGTVFRVDSASSDDEIAETSEAINSGVWEVTITPKKPGVVTISVIVGNDYYNTAPRTLSQDPNRFTLTKQFTVARAAYAPLLNIQADPVTPGEFNRRGDGTEGQEIVYTIRHDHTGTIGMFSSTAQDIDVDNDGTDERIIYRNRNLIYSLSNGADILPFTISQELSSDGQTMTGTLTAAPRATDVDLAVRDYTFTVVLSDQVSAQTVGTGDDAINVQAGRTDSAEVTVRVIQGNRPPMVEETLPTITIVEGTPLDTVLIDLDDYASDPDRQTLTFGLIEKAGADPAENLGNTATGDGVSSNDVVRLNSATNAIELKVAVDYEDVDADGVVDSAAQMAAATYDPDAPRWRGTVTVTDGALTVERKIAFRVGDADEVVTPAAGLSFSIDENNDAGATVGTVGIPLTRTANAQLATEGYALNPDANGGGIFAISDAGVLTVTNANALDYEDTTIYQLVVTADGLTEGSSVLRPVTVNVRNVNEAPEFTFGPGGDSPATDPTNDRTYEIAGQGYATGTTGATPEEDREYNYVALISEAADVGDEVTYGAVQDSSTAATLVTFRGAMDEDADDTAANFTYSLLAANTADAAAFSGPFAINASTGAITVSQGLNAERLEGNTYTMFVRVSDDGSPALYDTVQLTITVSDENESPIFVTAANSTTELETVAPVAMDEDTVGHSAQNPRTTERVVATYYAWDPDGNDIDFILRTARDSDFFEITWEKTSQGRATGTLKMAANQNLDYENKSAYQVEIEVVDVRGGQNQILQTVNLNNLNDNAPVWQQTHTQISVAENSLRGTLLATYTATDADCPNNLCPGTWDGDPITYTVGGTNGRSYQIGSADGMLKTLASLDAETNSSDSITVTASDGANSTPQQDTRIDILNVDDTIGSITVKMANPVLGTHGDPNSALADRKTTLTLSVPEAPGDLPATSGSSVVNFVETENARWNSTLRIEVLSVSPGTTCGNGNQCVVIELEGDDSDDVLNLMAYRNSAKDNLFVAAVMPVQSAAEATAGTAAVYKHSNGGVPRIQVDEEDTLRIKFGNLRDSVVIDNEAPEFANFLPEHEASIDDEEVDYSFTVTDAISGIPDPEDLPDGDGDDSYMPVVALVNSAQCHNVAANATSIPAGTSPVANTNLFEGARIFCPAGTTAEVRPIVDDKDLDDVDDGFEVSTEVVLAENRISYVTFIACDRAGNCVAFDPDENDTKEALAEITVDTVNPDLAEARTGVMWDAADNTYDDSRSFIQAIFDDLSDLNPDTIEADDFVVDGYTIRRVYWYDDPDTGDENWTTRFDKGSAAYRQIAKTVFIELEEELLPDATPDVSVVPNGLEDNAGNEQDDDEIEADDWIAPKFTVVSIESPRETSRDNVLVGEDEKVVLNVTSDERISTTKPLVDVDYVNAPAGCVDRAGIILRTGRDTDGDGRVEPQEARADCAMTARGSSLNSVISKDGTNEWTITVDKPTATGYYNVYIYADDRSSQSNTGSEGVAPAKIATDFFEKDGDVNADDAVFFEGDVQLPKPQVVVSGEDAGDTEPTVEFKRPLFIEIDFTEPFSADCSAGDKLSNELECTAESAEYAEDGFDAVTITRFELNGVDMTEDVRTTDSETFLVALDDIEIGDHEIKIQATDVAGNELKDVLEIEFEVEERDPFTRRLNPGWNLVSLPGSPADSAIASIFGSDIEVRTVYTYNPVTPGGWQVAVRETLDDAWQGDLTDITAKSGYWVLSDAIQDLEVSIPRLAGGAVGRSTPLQPPVIPMYAGWNLIPVVDVTGDALDTDKSINATTYLNSLDDGLDLARVLGFNTITNEWFTVIDPSDSSVTDDLQIGSAYWVFVRESASLVPGGIPR